MRKIFSLLMIGIPLGVCACEESDEPGAPSSSLSIHAAIRRLAQSPEPGAPLSDLELKQKESREKQAEYGRVAKESAARVQVIYANMDRMNAEHKEMEERLARAMEQDRLKMAAQSHLPENRHPLENNDFYDQNRAKVLTKGIDTFNERCSIQ